MNLGLSLSLTSAALRQGGGVDYVTQYLSPNGEDYAEFVLTDLSKLFQDAAGTTPVSATGQVIGRANVKAVGSHNAQQSSSTFKPQFQATGAKFDGADDNLVTDWFAQAGENCIIAQIDVPVTIASTQLLAGANDATPNRYYLGVDPSGILGAGVGTQGNGIIKGGADLRGQSVVVCLSVSGSVVKLFSGETEVYSAAQSGALTTSIAARIGALGGAGGASQYWGGSIKHIAFGKKAITLEQFKQIRNQWLAAA
jgi:hypothetical protein